MKIIFLFFNLMIAYACYAEEITPYKFTDSLPFYEIPPSSRFTVKPPQATEVDVVYYFSKPKSDTYPIAIVCGGSSRKESIYSIIHVHRYLLEEFLDLNVGVITVEQRGVDGNVINPKEFMEHCTRSKRLKDHQTVIEHLMANPPIGWNGKFVFLGVSEGGPLVTSLTTQYTESTIATINWSGAGDWSWREELWLFLQKLLINNPECPHQSKLRDCGVCLEHVNSRELYTARDSKIGSGSGGFASNFPSSLTACSRALPLAPDKKFEEPSCHLPIFESFPVYDALMDAIILDPTSNRHFLGMTYKYHADAMLYPKVDYEKIQAPFLVVAGTEDTIIPSADAFVEKARNSGANITYLRVEGMDHYVRKRTDIVDQSFEWLSRQLEGVPSN